MLNTFPNIKRKGLKILQVNLGYKCNQACIHCHVNAGPHRKEMMNSENISLIPRVIDAYKIKTIDLTGGAPELHPEFRDLVKTCRKQDIEVIDRCNLTILSEKNQEYLAEFLAENKVIITASLPCFEKENVDKQRGDGVFERSIYGLKLLNELGYGKDNSDLELNLVYNPQGANLPPSQSELERLYKKELYNNYKIHFSNLFTITNMPIKRFELYLNSEGIITEYMDLLKRSYNRDNLNSLMCRELISIDWQGYLYDCDFNQQLGLNLKKMRLKLKDLLEKRITFNGQEIIAGPHCFGCTAGSGSSCSGSLSN